MVTSTSLHSSYRSPFTTYQTTTHWNISPDTSLSITKLSCGLEAASAGLGLGLKSQFWLVVVNSLWVLALWNSHATALFGLITESFILAYLLSFFVNNYCHLTNTYEHIVLQVMIHWISEMLLQDIVQIRLSHHYIGPDWIIRMIPGACEIPGIQMGGNAMTLSS